MDENLAELGIHRIARPTEEDLERQATELIHIIAGLTERIASLEDKVCKLTTAQENIQRLTNNQGYDCIEPNTLYISYKVNSLGDDMYSIVTYKLSKFQSTEHTSQPIRFPSQPGKPAELILLSDTIYSLLCHLQVKVVLQIPQVLYEYTSPTLGLDATLIARLDLLWNEIRNLEQMGSLVTVGKFPF